jgi:hypothetical protein
MSLREKIEDAFISHVDSNGYSGVWPEVISSLADIAAVCATDEVADLQARLEAAEKDAARYRILRDQGVDFELDGQVHSVCEYALDDVLDAALSKKAGA